MIMANKGAYKNDSKKKFLEAFERNLGNISASCKAANISRMAYYDWMKGDDEFKIEVDALKEAQLDLAESALKKQIVNGNTTAIIFYLKTQAKDRGYVERMETTGEQGGPIKLSWKALDI